MDKEKAKRLIDPLFFAGVAHRGLWDKDSTENGMDAFKKAIDKGFAFEYDIHLTKDEQLVVCHDEELERTTGKKGIIEHLTLKEIKEGYRLHDGGEIPTLQEVIDLNNGRVPMVVELKPFESNYKALGKKAYQALANIEDKSKIIIISFDPRALLSFGKHGFARHLLLLKRRMDVFLTRHFFEGIDIEITLVEDRRIKRYFKNHVVNLWTLESLSDLELIAGKVDTVTFQKIAPEKVREYFPLAQ